MSRGMPPAVCVLLCAALFASAAAQQNRITATIDNSQTIILKGSVSPLTQSRNDLGPLDPSKKLPYVTMLLQPSAAQELARRQLLADQQNPNSENYHKWLTPEEYGERFGLSRTDIAAIKHWLRLEGFTVVEVARARNWIAFSGTVGQVQQAFHTQIHRISVEGEERFANVTAPSVPKALQGIVSGFRGLDNFKLKSMMVKKQARWKSQYTDGFGDNFLAPDDIATIYDLGPLYSAGIDGTGMKIAVMGQTDVHTADIQQFRAGFNLSTTNLPTTIVPNPGCQDPGFTADEGEADLDLEWSGAVARNASIIFVTCDVNSGNGVIGSLQYAVNNNTAPVLSMSYGSCEADNAAGFATAYQQLVQQANAQGQTLMVSSGDSGAATCDSSGSSQATQGLGVNVLASPSEVTAVGGTEFNEGGGSYWNTNNGTNGGNALSYIPEVAWDDSSAGTGLSAGLSSTGGGVSIYFTKPTWQTGTGKFDPLNRSVPDLAMPASADHDGYIFCTNVGGSTYSGSCANGIPDAVANSSIVGGTSVACPVFAGIVTLLNQQLKNTPPAGLGNINPNLYTVAASVPTAFHDVTGGTYDSSGNQSGNVVPCQTGTTNCTTGTMGFLTGTGYDEVTGLGSVDANVLVTNWAGTGGLTPTTTRLTITPSATVNTGSSVTLTATISPAPPDGETVTFLDTTTASTLGSGSTVSGVATFTSAKIAGGTYNVEAKYAGDTTLAASQSTSSALNVQDFTIGPSNLSITIIAPGQSGSGTINLTMLGGLSQAPTFSCSGLPSESTCTFTAASATSETITVSTTAATSLLEGPLGRRNPTYYALLLPLMLGLLLLPVQKHHRTLTLGAVLVLSTLFLPACSSSTNSSTSGGQHNQGTPTGQTNVIVTATESSISHNITVTLNIQ